MGCHFSGCLAFCPPPRPSSYIARLHAFWAHTRAWAAPVPGLGTEVGFAVLAAVAFAATAACPPLYARPVGQRGLRWLATAAGGLLGHAGAAFVLAWGLYVGVFHWLANLPVSRAWRVPGALQIFTTGRWSPRYGCRSLGGSPSI